MRTAVSLSLLIVISGCSASTSSRNIRTGGVVALIDVTSASAGSSSVDTELVIGGSSSNTNVVLEGGDALSAQAGGDTKPLNVQGSGEYGTTFATSEGEFVVSLARDVDSPAPNNRGTIGPAFEISIADDKVSRKNDALKLSWDPVDPESEVDIDLSGDCLISEHLTLGRDTGSATFKAGKLRAWKSKKKDACVVEVTVTRTRLGTTDPALDRDSRFRLRQVRKASFTSKP